MTRWSAIPSIFSSWSMEFALLHIACYSKPNNCEVDNCTSLSLLPTVIYNHNPNCSVCGILPPEYAVATAVQFCNIVKLTGSIWYKMIQNFTSKSKLFVYLRIRFGGLHFDHTMQL